LWASESEIERPNTTEMRIKYTPELIQPKRPLAARRGGMRQLMADLGVLEAVILATWLDRSFHTRAIMRHEGVGLLHGGSEGRLTVG
jgi:hypothetical protein